MRAGIGGLRREYASAFATTRRAFRAPALRKVVVAFGAASAIEAAAWLAIGVYAYERSGSTGVGLVGLVILLPSAIVAPAAAAFADRHARRRILLVSYVVQALALAATAVVLWADAPAVLVYAAATVAALAITPIRPAQGALLPSLSTQPADLPAANVALTTIRNVGLLVGPLAAGLLLRVSGPEAVYAAAAVLGGIGAWLLALVPRDEPQPAPTVSASASLAHGFRLLARERRASYVIGLAFAKHVVMGALRAFLVIAALGLLRMGPGGPGVLSTALGVGGALGAGTALLLVGRRRLTPALIAGALLLGLPVAAIGVWPTVALAVVALALSGIGRSLIDIGSRTLLGRVSPDEALARFLGMLDGSSYAGLAIGSASSAALVEAVGTRGALIVVGASLPIVVFVLLKALKSLDRGPLVSQDRLALILGVPMLAPLPPESVERLASRLESIAAEDGTALIRQGEVGDRFYILDTGSAEAEVDGRRVASYGPGDSFGEIALLHDVPRTATVRATSPSRVVALERAVFLSVLTDEPLSRAEAERTAADRLLDTAAHLREP